jgi:E3 ubiquitin-protein ligase TRIP12
MCSICVEGVDYCVSWLQNLIGLLAKLACTSLVAVKSLFELGVSSTIKGILITSDISHGMPYLPLEKQNNQVDLFTSLLSAK